MLPPKEKQRAESRTTGERNSPGRGSRREIPCQRQAMPLHSALLHPSLQKQQGISSRFAISQQYKHHEPLYLARLPRTSFFISPRAAQPIRYCVIYTLELLRIVYLFYEGSPSSGLQRDGLHLKLIARTRPGSSKKQPQIFAKTKRSLLYVVPSPSAPPPSF
jgi:hypothetical protein